jgi:hypothetical protein
MALIAVLHAADFNASAPQALSMQSGSARYIVRRASLTNCTAGPYGAVFGVGDSERYPGDPIVPPGTQVTSGLDIASQYADLPLGAICAVTSFGGSGGLWLKVATPQGSPCAGDLYVWGDLLE